MPESEFQQFHSEPQAVSPWAISKFMFRQRFTFEERVMLRMARESSVYVRTWYDDFESTEFVDLKRPEVQQGVAFLVSIFVISLERATVILTTPLRDDEIYKGK